MGQGVNIVHPCAVVNSILIEKGTLIVQKKREFQQSFTPFLTDHFVAAQQMFETSACLGIYIYLSHTTLLLMKFQKAFMKFLNSCGLSSMIRYQCIH
jgi:hypothetical protein